MSISNLSQWYSKDNSGSLSISFDPAAVAFEEGIKVFKAHLTKDPKKRLQIDSIRGNTLKDVLDVVKGARSRYINRRGKSKAQECLLSFSARVSYYGNIMDVLVQQHPEYVSLVWGAMKLLFGSVVEHENTISTLATALCDIADSLPRVELAACLYATQMMQQAVATLYAHIIHFLIRALTWYEQGKLAHAIHSITRPAALRYDDIIQNIEKESRKIVNHAVASSQAELRDMHIAQRNLHQQFNHASTESWKQQQNMIHSLDELSARIVQIQSSITPSQTVQANVQMSAQVVMTKAQFDQTLVVLSSQSTIDHSSALRFCKLLQRRYKGLPQSKSTAFSVIPALREWDSFPSSSTALMTSKFSEINQLRGFCAKIVDQLLQKQVTVLWIFKNDTINFQLSEIFKSLIFQALKQECVTFASGVFPSLVERFLCAKQDEDYVSLLGQILRQFSLAYIIIDSWALSQESAIGLIQCMQRISQTLDHQGAQTILKTVIIDQSSQRERFRAVNQFVIRTRDLALRKKHRRSQ